MYFGYMSQQMFHHHSLVQHIAVMWDYTSCHELFQRHARLIFFSPVFYNVSLQASFEIKNLQGLVSCISIYAIESKLISLFLQKFSSAVESCKDSQVAHSLGDCRIGSSVTDWHRPQVKLSPALSLLNPKCFDFFFPSPFYICLDFFLAKEGFNIQGLVKVWHVFSVHKARKEAHQKNPKTYLWAYVHIVHALIYTLYAHYCTCFLLSSPQITLALSQHPFFIPHYVIKAACEINADAQSLHANTHELQRVWQSAFHLFMLLLFLLQPLLWSLLVFVFFCIWTSKQWTTFVWLSRSCLSMWVFCACCTQEEVSVKESGLPTPTHGAQTKQQDECFLNSTWHSGTPIYPCGSAEWLKDLHSEQMKEEDGGGKRKISTGRKADREVQIVHFKFSLHHRCISVWIIHKEAVRLLHRETEGTC